MGRARHLGEDAVDLLHLRRAADQATHVLLCAQPLPQTAALQVEVQPLARPAQHTGQLLQREGLGQVVAGSDAHRLHRGGDGGKGRHHHDARLRIQALDLAQQLQPAAAGQLQVEQKHIHRLLPQHAQRLRHIARRERDETHPGGDLAARLAHRSVVVHHQKAKRRHPLGQTMESTLQAIRPRDLFKHLQRGKGHAFTLRWRTSPDADISNLVVAGLC